MHIPVHRGSPTHLVKLNPVALRLLLSVALLMTTLSHLADFQYFILLCFRLSLPHNVSYLGALVPNLGILTWIFLCSSWEFWLRGVRRAHY